MTSRSPNHPRPRPLSSTALPPAAQDSPVPTLKRKYSLDHGEAADLSEWRAMPGAASTDLTDDREGSSAEVTKAAAGGEEERSPLLAIEDVNHNRPSLDAKEARRKVPKKQTSFECVGCDDNYFYDFFDRNCRPPPPATPDEETPSPSPCVTPGAGSGRSVEENNNEGSVNTAADSGASSRIRRNVNGVRPRSWLTTTSTGKVEDPKRVRRRQTDPCGKDFLSNYERALSSLLYQPYECRSEGPSTSTSTTFDDSDVGYWLGGGDSRRWRVAERRGAGQCCAYQNESSESSSSVTSSSSSLAEFIRGKPWGDCKDPSSSSIRALLTDWRPLPLEGVSVSDLDARLAREPAGALATGSATMEREREGERESQSQSAARHGGAMLVTVVTGDRESDARCRGDLPSATATTTTSVQCEEVSVCYRAVPATVAAVPSIPCSSNVSNVRIVQAGGSGQRTFTSTEAQTDDVIVDAIRPAPAGNPAREQRRRERRERRHQRRLATHLHQPPDPAVWQTPLGDPLVDRLPDILNSHLPPPYTTLPLGLPPPIAVTTVPGSPPPPPPPPQPPGLRFPFAIVPAGRRRSRLSPHFTPEDEPKSCCGVAVSQTISIRWFIILIFLVGICCAVVGTILGAMKATGREHLTVSLLMIGVGVVLVAVSGVAWRLTAQDAPSCRALLGLAADDSSGEPNRRFVPRLPPSYGRPHHPYAAMMYPEFQYRAPPPSYQASMQEYRLRLLLLDRHSSGAPATTISPPPTYRSQAGSLLRAPIGLRGREMHTPSQSEYSRPPSYRSRTSSRPDAATAHSREPSDPDPGQAVNVITVHPHIIKLAPSPPLPAKNGKDSNMVTIVQTGSEPTGPVIVTISGQESDPQAATHSGMEILAHL